MPTFDAYHIFRQRGAPTWTARHHRMIFSDPIPADEAVQRVATGLSCYVEVDGLQTAIEHLAQLGVTVKIQAQGKGKEL